MRITIEPTKDINNELHLHSAISIQHPCADIVTAMDLMVTAMQAWGFADESIAEFLETDFATDRGLISSPEIPDN